MRLIERFNITDLAFRTLSGAQLLAFKRIQTEIGRRYLAALDVAQADYARAAGGDNNLAWSNGGREAWDSYMEERSALMASLKRDLAKALLQIKGRAA